MVRSRRCQVMEDATDREAAREQASLQCKECQQHFPASMPLDRAALARSGLQFMVERCPMCGASGPYRRDEYRYPRHRLSA